MKSNRMFLLWGAIFVMAGFAFMHFTRQVPKHEGGTVAATPADPSLLERPHSPVKGAADAPVTIVEFLDPECESCRAMHPIVKQLLAEYSGKVRLVIRYLPFHGNSRLAAAALEEARAQGKFDQALDALFERQPEWGDHARPRPELIPEILAKLGMDKAKLNADYLLAEHGAKVDLDHEDAKKLGVKYTPTFYVNRMALEQIGYAPVKEAIDRALAAR